MSKLLRIALILVATFAVSSPVGISRVEAETGPIARALIISIDGLRPDVLMSADTPVFHALMERSTFSLRAVTTPLCNTLPSHVSMLTGVAPSVHGVDWNGDLPAGQHRYPKRPTLFELARKAGFTTAMVAGKTKFATLDKPGTLDWSYVAKDRDEVVTATAVRLIDEHAPQVLFVHLPGVDIAGHRAGWASPQQLAAVSTADRCVGRILLALQNKRLLDSTVVVVTSDHGGNGKSHRREDPLSRYIPWITSGPGIRKNVDLTSQQDVEIATEDTFATVCALLGIAVPEPIKGRFVHEILAPSAATRNSGP